VRRSCVAAPASRKASDGSCHFGAVPVLADPRHVLRVAWSAQRCVQCGPPVAAQVKPLSPNQASEADGKLFATGGYDDLSCIRPPREGALVVRYMPASSPLKWRMIRSRNTSRRTLGRLQRDLIINIGSVFHATLSKVCRLSTRGGRGCSAERRSPEPPAVMRPFGRLAVLFVGLSLFSLAAQVRDAF
jgi:hypothetical protein